MCYICNCLAWSVDMIQRTITFCLLACLICVICLGLTACVVAGIAYGYNYMLAEFMTHTRSDVTVYMRRGQINERPDLAEYVRRRAGDDTEPISNISSLDYQEPEPPIGEKQPLSETLVKPGETLNYAEKLTKFSKSVNTKSDVTTEHQSSENAMNFYRYPTPPMHRISILPNPAIQTTVLQSGTSEIIMRKFPAVKDISADVTKKIDTDYFYYKMNNKPEPEDRDMMRPKMYREETGEIFDDDVKKLEDTKSYPTRSIPMRYFDGSTLDIEDENIAYRPI